MKQDDSRVAGAAPAPAPGQPSQTVAHTGAGAGTALDAMLRTRQMRPKRDGQSDAEPPIPAAPPAPASGDDTERPHQ